MAGATGAPSPCADWHSHCWPRVWIVGEIRTADNLCHPVSDCLRHPQVARRFPGSSTSRRSSFGISPMSGHSSQRSGFFGGSCRGMNTCFGMSSAFIFYYVAMGVYNEKWVKCNLELRFGKNENFKIYLRNGKLGKWIWESKGVKIKRPYMGGLFGSSSDGFQFGSFLSMNLDRRCALRSETDSFL